MFVEADSTFLAVENFEGNKANGLVMPIDFENEGEKRGDEKYPKIPNQKLADLIDRFEEF